jgi:hypothetical protein
LITAVLFASGCPAREQAVLITAGGAQSLTVACNRGACVRTADEDAGADPSICPGSCALPGHLPPDFSLHTQARLFVVTPDDNIVRDASKCMTLPILCKGTGRPGCLAEALNQQLDGAIANGLGFTGLKNPDDVELFMAFYQQQDFLEDPEETQPTCRRVDLVACAGLAPPLGGGAYDMSCASCQDGPRNPASRDNGPCPRDSTNSCFLEKCDAWLAMNGYQ